MIQTFIGPWHLGHVFRTAPLSRQRAQEAVARLEHRNRGRRVSVYQHAPDHGLPQAIVVELPTLAAIDYYLGSMETTEVMLRYQQTGFPEKWTERACSTCESVLAGIEYAAIELDCLLPETADPGIRGSDYSVRWLWRYPEGAPRALKYACGVAGAFGSLAHRDLTVRRALLERCIHAMGLRGRVRLIQSYPGAECEPPLSVWSLSGSVPPLSLEVRGFDSLTDARQRADAVVRSLGLRVVAVDLTVRMSAPRYEEVKSAIAPLAPAWNISVLGRLRDNVDPFAPAGEPPGPHPVWLPLLDWQRRKHVTENDTRFTFDWWYSCSSRPTPEGVILEFSTNEPGPAFLLKEVQEAAGLEPEIVWPKTAD